MGSTTLPAGLRRVLASPSAAGDAFASKERSGGVRLDCLDRLITQPEMMPDLVHQHMGDDRFERIIGLAPFIEDRPTVEKDHVRQCAARFIALQPDMPALVKAQNLPFALQLHLRHHLGIGKILDAQQHCREMIAEQFGEPFDCRLGERFDIGQRRRKGLTGGHGAGIGQALPPPQGVSP